MAFQAYRRSSLWFVFLCYLVLFFTGQQVSAQVETEKRSFDISEGYAINTLKEAAKQAGVEFIFSADLVKGVRTSSIKGTYTPLEAFSLMLAETSLAVFQHEQSGVYAITKVSDIQIPELEPKPIEQTEMNTKNSNWLKTLAAILAVGIPNGRSALTAQENSDDIVNLTPFIVSSSNDEIYSTQQSNTGTIFAIDRDSIPFVTSVVTEEMIEDMALDNPADLSEQMAGVSKDSNPLIADEGGQASLTFRVRGFTSEPLYNGFQTGGISHGTDNVGRVEVSKGANSVLYGQSPAGGVINLVPKAPQFTDHSRLTVGAGSNDSTRVIFEMGGPTASENTGKVSAYRFGGSHQEFEREQIFFHAQLQTFWGAHTWQFNENVTLELQTEILEFENTPSRTPAFVSTGSGPDRVVDPFNRLRNDRNFSYNGPHSFNERDTWLSTGFLTVNLSDSLTARAGIFFGEQERNSIVLGDMYGLGTNENANPRYTKSNVDRATFAQKIDLLHQIQFGSLRFDSLLGFENHEEDSTSLSLRQDRDAFPTPVLIPFSRKPVASDYPAPPPPQAFTDLRSDSDSRLDWTNIRFTQLISSGSDNWNLMWGLARGDGEAFTTDRRQNATSLSVGDDTTYTVGGTVRVFEDADSDSLNKVILFANTSTSFLVQSGNQQDPSIFDGFSTVEELTDFVNNIRPNPLDPQTGQGYEFGARFDFAQGKFGLNVLYFDQTRENIARSFFVRESRVAGSDSENLVGQFQLASGEENAKGVEIGFHWNPTPNLVVLGEAQITDGKVVSNIDAPQEEGFGLIRSPEDMYTFWTMYNAPDDSSLSGFSLGLGASYNSSTRIRPQINDRFRVSDDYTMARMLVRYTWKSDKLEQQLSLNVENLLDDEFTMEDNFLSEPRIYKLAYTVRL